MKRLLLVTYHMPPALGSGVQRMLSLTQYLPDHGWQVDVLTVSTNVFEQVEISRLKDIPAACQVIRAPSLDAAKHLSILGRYPQRIALPDRWSSWAISGVYSGLRYIRNYRPDAIASSYPLASAHLLAARLQARTGLPWLADFRDPMCQDDYPSDPRVWDSFNRVEQRTFEHATAFSFTSPSALSFYQRRYPKRPASDFALIHNGYDETLFDRLPEKPKSPSPSAPLTLLHSGLLYPWERDPLPFFAALAALRDDGFWQQHPTKVVLRASGYDAHYRPLLDKFGLTSLVELAQPLPYEQALAEICHADGLLLLQASNSNFQIPAKTYEYLRSGRPILALVDPAGDSAATLREAGTGTIVEIGSSEAITAGLRGFIEALARERNRSVVSSDIQRYSRTTAAAEFAAALNRITA